MPEFNVSGVDKVRGNFQTIKDTVQAKDRPKAMKAARKKYPRAPEIKVAPKPKGKS